MSTKSRRAGTATPQPGGTSTPLQQPSTAAGGGSGGQRGGGAASPLSPTRHSRLAEKVELQNLNDRLACYIDRVRNLETENARLNIEVQTTRETVTRETSNIKSIFECELAEARRLLDETAKERAKLEIDTKRMFEENDELRAKLDKKTKDCSIAEGSARMYESRANDLTTKYNAANVDRKKAVDELNDALKELDRLRKLYDELRKNLEDETLARVELENTVQSLREELSFKDQIHTQEINESRSRRQVEISEIDGRLCEQYEAKLQQSLQELRAQYEDQMRGNRDEIESLYENKIKNLQASANRNSLTATNTIEELRTTRKRIDGLNARIADLENTNSALNVRIRELEQQLDQERARHTSDICALESELQRLREEMAQQLQEYQDLMDIKVSLDLEIAAYDKLLCGEESRLNITPSTATTATVSSFSQSLRSSRATPIRKTPSRSVAGATGGGAAKRKRTVIEESEDLSQSEFFVSSNAKGDVQILEVDSDGKFIKLHNKGAKEVAIGGWQLQSIGGDGKTATNFKFHRSVKIEPNAVITVWSSDVIGVAHEPPTNIVMKQQKWTKTGNDTIRTLLVSSEGDEAAGYERIKRTIITHTSRHRGGAASSGHRGVTAVDGNEDLYHQQGDPQQPGDEKCSIM